MSDYPGPRNFSLRNVNSMYTIVLFETRVLREHPVLVLKSRLEYVLTLLQRANLKSTKLILQLSLSLLRTITILSQRELHQVPIVR